MAGGNLSPRQKMIGMMYLVLTALLALNVSKDILDAFVLVNDSLKNTVSNYTEKNETLYAEFNQAKSFDPIKVGPFWEKAQKAKQKSNELVNYIKSLQHKLYQETEKITEQQADTLTLQNVSSKDNYDIPTYLMVGENENISKGLAQKLKHKLIKYKQEMFELFSEDEQKLLSIDIDTDDKVTPYGKESWEMANFYHTPLAATITILSKLQTDVKNVEYEVVNQLFKSVRKRDFNFDTIAAKVISPSNYVLLGEKYQSDVFVAAFSTTQNPEILIGKYDSVKNTLSEVYDSVNVSKGMGKYEILTDKEGIFSYQGVIKLKTPGSNETQQYPFQSEYIVAKPSLVVSPDQMNVFYIGPKNPVSISVPGVASENITATITGSGNRITKVANGKYEVKLSNNSPRNVDVKVSARMPNGETRSMGAMGFIVKRLPTPYAEVGTVSNQMKTLPKAQILAYSTVKAKYDNSFPFQGLPLNVVKYKIDVFRSGVGGYSKPVNGKNIPQDAKTYFNTLRRGDIIYFTGIKARDATGAQIPLNDVAIKVR